MKTKQLVQGGLSSRSGLPLLTAALVSLGLVSPSSVRADIQTAGDLFVNIDATGLSEGSLPSIENKGSLSGFFEARGGDGTIPVIATEGGTKGIRFDGTDFMQLVDAVGGALVPPPDGLVGLDPTRSIEVWALNPDVANEETMVSWGKRGGPDGTNVSFGYGSDLRWGAVGHWGGDGPDIGWNNNGGNPPANKWHHLVYTYDGSTSRVYVDGALDNFEFLGTGVMNTWPGTSINLATQLEGDGTTPTVGLRGSLTIAKVRIHDDVLTADQILNNYNFEKAAFIDPAPPADFAPVRLSTTPIHRYSFNDPATDDASGATVTDSVGGANGSVLGTGSAYTGSRLRLTDGGSSGSAAYVDLPNGLLSANGKANGGTGEFTIEGWFHHTTSHTWSRIFDFGSSGSQEVTGPGGGGQGTDYLELSAQIGDDVNSRRMEVRNEDPAGGGISTADFGVNSFGTDVHFAVTWDEASGTVSAYENGRFKAKLTTTAAISDINDVNVWLGRSNWTADQNLQGEFDEVRIYSKVLTEAELFGNSMAGPDLLNNADAPVTIATDPVSRTAPDGTPVTFSARAYGSSPLFYQWLRNGQPLTGETTPSLSVNTSSANDGAKYSLVVSNIVGGKFSTATSKEAVLTLKAETVALKHRYSFNDDNGSTTAVDSEGGDPGLLVGGASIADGVVTLDGVDGYVNLPNGIISSLGNATLEMWVTWNGGPVWSRLFDFGVSDAGEDNQGAGIDYLFFSPRIPGGFARFEANAPNGGVTTGINPQGSFPQQQETHLVITYNSTAGIARVYQDGVLEVTGPTGFDLSTLNDINNWLGRSQFHDPYYNGTINEFRIYNGAMSGNEVAASFAAGPNATIGGGDSPFLTITKGAAGKVTISWASANAAGYQLQSAAKLGAGAVWTAVAAAPVAQGATLQVSLDAGSAAAYYRLAK